MAPLRISVVVRSNVPGGKSGVGHEKGGSEEPPSRKHMVEVLGARPIKHLEVSSGTSIHPEDEAPPGCPERHS